jgi:hypothetical protein
LNHWGQKTCLLSTQNWRRCARSGEEMVHSKNGNITMPDKTCASGYTNNSTFLCTRVHKAMFKDKNKLQRVLGYLKLMKECTLLYVHMERV